MEFLLINHPLDCPICDQGGECDLQDQAMGYGRDRSRFNENKRAVEDKYMGPLVKTDHDPLHPVHPLRALHHRSRGVPDMGAIGRGEDIGDHHLSGKRHALGIAGQCGRPVPGRRADCRKSSMPSMRGPGSCSKTESIDVMDALGCNIRVDARGREVMRVLPRLNEEVNEEWISDKARHACDGLMRQRLDRPMCARTASCSRRAGPRPLPPSPPG